MNIHDISLLIDEYASAFHRLMMKNNRDADFTEADLAVIAKRNDILTKLQERDQQIANYVRDGVANFYEEQFHGSEAFASTVGDRIKKIEVSMAHHACIFSYDHGGWKLPPVLPSIMPTIDEAIDVHTATGAHLDLIAKFSNHPLREEGETDDAFRKRMLVYRVPVTVEQAIDNFVEAASKATGIHKDVLMGKAWPESSPLIPGFEGVRFHLGNTEAAAIGSELDPESIEQGEPK